MRIRKSTLFTVFLLSMFCAVIQAADDDLTPMPGDPLRKQVLDGLRKDVHGINGEKVVFVVRYLKVKDGWAWVHAMPQSPDIKNRYEDVSALLQLKDGDWKVVEMPCTEVDNPECIDGAGYYEQLKNRFPDAPDELFPESVPEPE